MKGDRRDAGLLSLIRFADQGGRRTPRAKAPFFLAGLGRPKAEALGYLEKTTASAGAQGLALALLRSAEVDTFVARILDSTH